MHELKPGDKVKFTYNKRRTKYGEVKKIWTNLILVKFDENKTPSPLPAERLTKITQ